MHGRVLQVISAMLSGLVLRPNASSQKGRLLVSRKWVWPARLGRLLLYSKANYLQCLFSSPTYGPLIHQGVVIPYTAVVTAKTGVKKWSRGQAVFLVAVKRSKTSFKLSWAVKMQLRWSHEVDRHGQTVKSLFTVWSSGQAAKMTVKISWPRS